MTPVVVSPKADEDVSLMLEHLQAVAGPAVMRRYVQELNAIYERLTLFPDSGPRRKSLGPHVRIAVLSPYVIIYEHVNGTVTIVRVLDGRRNVTRRLVQQ
jgi:toxin ParE1/3/4